MKVLIYSVDHLLQSPQQFHSLQPTTSIKINDHIYFNVIFENNADSKQIVLTVQSESHYSQSYTINPIFTQDENNYYHLEFQQHDPLPGKTFSGFLIFINYSNDLIIEKKISITVISPIQIEIVSFQNKIIELQINSLKNVEIVSFILQSSDSSYDHENFNKLIKQNIVYRDFIELDEQFYSQIKEKLADFDISIMYRENFEIFNIKFGFDLSQFIQKIIQLEKHQKQFSIKGKLTNQIPNSHNDLIKNDAYYCVQLDITNNTQSDLENIYLVVADIQNKVQPITKKLEIDLIHSKTTVIEYIELFSYYTNYIVPKITLSVNEHKFSFDEIVLFK